MVFRVSLKLSRTCRKFTGIRCLEAGILLQPFMQAADGVFSIDRNDILVYAVI